MFSLFSFFFFQFFTWVTHSQSIGPLSQGTPMGHNDLTRAELSKSNYLCPPSIQIHTNPQQETCVFPRIKPRWKLWKIKSLSIKLRHLRHVLALIAFYCITLQGQGLRMIRYYKLPYISQFYSINGQSIMHITNLLTDIYTQLLPFIF